MKILGLRNFSDGIRYCILELKENTITCVNKDTEHKICKPKGIQGKELYKWYNNEIKRILDTNQDISAVAIKQNENSVLSCYGKLKDIMFFDCIASMVSYEHNLDVSSFVYNQLGVSSKTVKECAENILGGKLSRYWDEKIADAIVVAYKLLKS